MIHPNTIAGVCLGAVLVLTALSVPAIHQDTAPRVPHAIVAPARTLDSLTQVVETQRAEARTFHEDAQRVASMVEPTAPSGTVSPRRAHSRPSQETPHGGRP